MSVGLQFYINSLESEWDYRHLMVSRVISSHAGAERTYQTCAKVIIVSMSSTMCLCICTKDHLSWRVINSYGCSPLSDSHQDKKTYKHTQTSRWTNKQTKAKAAMNSKLPGVIYTGWRYSTLDKCTVLHNYEIPNSRIHPDFIDLLNSTQDSGTGWLWYNWPMPLRG